METKIATPQLNALGVSDEEARQIGLRLQQKREQNQTDSISDISKRLKLNTVYLEIIESGTWDNLPHSANGQGFVRLYAKELGVTLPEFDKFMDNQKSLVAPNRQTNLDKIVECARVKRLVHMNSYETMLLHTMTALKKMLTFKRPEQIETYAQPKAEPSLEIAVTNEVQETVEERHVDKKKLIILGSAIAFGIGITISTIVFKNNALFLNTDVSDQTSDTQDNFTNNQIEAQAIPDVDVKVANPEPIAQVRQQVVNEAVQVAPQPSESIQGTIGAQKLQLDILSPVSIQIETDGKQIIDGLTQPGIINLEFKNKAVLIVSDSSKVKLSYAGWNHELLSLGTRKRTIVLNAKSFGNYN